MRIDTKKLKRLLLLNFPHIFVGLIATNLGEGWRLAEGANSSEKLLSFMTMLPVALQNPLPSFYPLDLLIGLGSVTIWNMDRPAGEHTINCKELFMDAKEDNAMTQYNKITALYSRLSVGDEDRDGGESNSIVNQKAFLERYARQEKLPNIRHYIDDDESGRFFDRSAYVRMMDDVESGKIGIVVMKDMTRWGRDYCCSAN